MDSDYGNVVRLERKLQDLNQNKATSIAGVMPGLSDVSRQEERAFIDQDLPVR